MLRRQLVDLPRLAARCWTRSASSTPSWKPGVIFPAAFPKVYVDPDKIEQVLTNLVENACKYASPDGLRIEGDGR